MARTANPLKALPNLVNDELIASDIQTATEFRVAQAAELAANAERDAANRSHGVVQAMYGMRNLTAAAVINELRNLRESKGYRFIPLKKADNSTAVAVSFEEYCEIAHGMSTSVVNELILNVTTLGDAFDNFQRIGITRSALRKLRGLRDDFVADIKALGLTATSKDQLVDLIEDAHAKRLAAEARATEAEAQGTAKDSVMADMSKKLTSLTTAKKRVKSQDPDGDRIKQLERELTDASSESAKLIRVDHKDVLRQLEEARKVVCDPAAANRRKGTLADDVVVSFPSRDR